MATGTNTATANDLAGLGLDIGSLDTSDATTDTALAPAKQDAPVTPVPVDANAASPNEGADVANKKGTREAVIIGKIEIEDDVELTGLTRSRTSGGSKYKFHDIREPVRKEDGTFSYGAMLVPPAEGSDEAALKRSVQSASTQENSKGKGKGEGFEGKDVRYVTRTVEKAGTFLGMRVYRVDGTLEDAE